MLREEKIKFILESIEAFEGVQESPAQFETMTDEQLDHEVEWYDHLWEK